VRESKRNILTAKVNSTRALSSHSPQVQHSTQNTEMYHGTQRTERLGEDQAQYIKIEKCHHAWIYTEQLFHPSSLPQEDLDTFLLLKIY
jgi:hypothetical protein